MVHTSYDLKDDQTNILRIYWLYSLTILQFTGTALEEALFACVDDDEGSDGTGRAGKIFALGVDRHLIDHYMLDTLELMSR